MFNGVVSLLNRNNPVFKNQNGGLWVFMDVWSYALIDHVSILGIGLELAWNGVACGAISLKRN